MINYHYSKKTTKTTATTFPATALNQTRVYRIRVNEGRAQIYGTQFGRPLEDETNVDARRAEVGLERLADYLARRPK